ncbi:MAG: PEP-CTERM sorting domain-containing protein, partial [Planctomycetes bacterium]|nr:PEP-CTERM sorting domain-containing protein [Planctomycetota bacterium]
DLTDCVLTQYDALRLLATWVEGASMPTGEYALLVNWDNGASLYAIESVPQAKPGDCDRDGDVDATDLATLGLNWNPSGTDKTWAQGNFDESPAGAVDATDLAGLGLNWAPSGYAVPEPGTIALLGIGGLALRRKRRAFRPCRTTLPSGCRMSCARGRAVMLS